MFEPDKESAWPSVQHPHEAGGRAIDCHYCESPRMMKAGRVRMCASCGWSCDLYHCEFCDRCKPHMSWAEYRVALSEGRVRRVGEGG